MAGPLANKPLNGGEAWVRLNWLLGLRRLGYDVCLAEVIAPENCVDGAGVRTDFASSANRAYFEAVTAEFGLADSAGLICTGTHEAAGLGYDELLDRAADAELVFNVSGHLRLRELLGRPRLRAYVDMDPGFTQAWLASGARGLRLADHDRYVTVGANLGRPECPIPTGGLDWVPMAPPVVLGEWPAVGPAPSPGRFTTLATWRNLYGPVEIDGEARSLKHHEFRKVLELPGESRPRRSRSRSTSIRRMPTIWRRCARTAGESPIPIRWPPHRAPTASTSRARLPSSPLPRACT